MILTILIAIAVCAVIGNMIGKSRGSDAGGIVGAAFGPIGLIGMAFAKGKNVCPSCRTSNHKEACKCKGCGDKLNPIQPQEDTTFVSPVTYFIYETCGYIFVYICTIAFALLLLAALFT